MNCNGGACNFFFFFLICYRYFLYFPSFFFFSFFFKKNNNIDMPAREENKVVLLEHPSGSKASIALFGKEKNK